MNRKFLILLFCFLALCFSLFSCTNKGDFVAEIKVPQSIILGDDITALPIISSIYFSGKTRQAFYDDFWFEGQYTFVQDNKIKIKEKSPAEFTDILSIKLKENLSITAEMELIKHYVPLEEVAVSIATGKNECLSGESVKIITELTPKNASNKEILFEILEGYEFTEITKNGFLSVKKNTPKNSRIVLKAYSHEGVFSELILFVTERIKIFNAAQFTAIRNNPDVTIRLKGILILQNRRKGFLCQILAEPYWATAITYLTTKLKLLVTDLVEINSTGFLGP